MSNNLSGVVAGGSLQEILFSNYSRLSPFLLLAINTSKRQTIAMQNNIKVFRSN
jgi:hypothetical protein